MSRSRARQDGADFVVVGGGPTGRRVFRRPDRADPRPADQGLSHSEHGEMRVILLEALDSLLQAFPISCGP